MFPVTVSLPLSSAVSTENGPMIFRRKKSKRKKMSKMQESVRQLRSSVDLDVAAFQGGLRKVYRYSKYVGLQLIPGHYRLLSHLIKSILDI
jgi:hypothetical protein